MLSLERVDGDKSKEKDIIVARYKIYSSFCGYDQGLNFSIDIHNSSYILKMMCFLLRGRGMICLI